MSQALKIAVASRLAGNSALVASLAKDPESPADPAIFNATKDQSPPVYDCLTFRISQATPDRRFRPGLPGQAFTGGVEDFYLDCEAWTQTPDSAPLEAINARLDALFHFQAFPTGDGPVFFCERVTSQPDLYDKTLNAWFSLNRFRLRMQRTS